MGYSNYPDGMRERDIPGFMDVECPECGGDPDGCEFCDDTGMVHEDEANDYLLERRADDILDDREYWNRRG